MGKRTFRVENPDIFPSSRRRRMSCLKTRLKRADAHQTLIALYQPHFETVINGHSLASRVERIRGWARVGLAKLPINELIDITNDRPTPFLKGYQKRCADSGLLSSGRPRPLSCNSTPFAPCPKPFAFADAFAIRPRYYTGRLRILFPLFGDKTLQHFAFVITAHHSNAGCR